MQSTMGESMGKIGPQELDAIVKASEIIAGSTVSGAAKHLESGHGPCRALFVPP